MNAEPILTRVILALRDVRQEAIIIGNSGAALNGAPVTTLNIDFFIKSCKNSMGKLEATAEILGGILIKPDRITSNVYHIVNEAEDIYVDFMDNPSGMKSYASIRSRSTLLELGGANVHVASLNDIIKSKKATNRPKDLRGYIDSGENAGRNRAKTVRFPITRIDCPSDSKRNFLTGIVTRTTPGRKLEGKHVH